MSSWRAVCAFRGNLRGPGACPGFPAVFFIISFSKEDHSYKGHGRRWRVVLYVKVFCRNGSVSAETARFRVPRRQKPKHFRPNCWRKRCRFCRNGSVSAETGWRLRAGNMLGTSIMNFCSLAIQRVVKVVHVLRGCSCWKFPPSPSGWLIAFGRIGFVWGRFPL